MARIKISLPKISPLFSTNLPLMVNFINYGGHMGNDAVLVLCQEARLRFLDTLQFTELDFHGKSLIQADAAIVYKSEGFRGDTMSVELYIEDVSEYGFDFLYLIKNVENNIEIARAKTGMVFFDYELRKVTKAPLMFKDTYLK